jgi:hypothetical protein
MLSLTHAGCHFRTKLMDQAQAERFAHCLDANARFAKVTVEESRSAGRFFVSFLPAAPERQAEMLETVQSERLVRALTEGSDYVFVVDDSARFMWCFNPRSGETWEVTSQSCTCPDHVYRCSRVGLKCKHQLALIHGQGEVRSW